MRDTLNARIGLLNPRSSRTPTDSPTAMFSTALKTLCATRTCPGSASAHNRAARLVTLPIAA